MTDVIVTPSLADAVSAAMLHARKAANAAATATEAATNSANAAEDVYHNSSYGPLPSDPVTRPDGTACQPGDQYFNTLQRAIKVFADNIWSVGLISSSQVSMLGANNLSDVSSISQSRINLGIKSAALLDAGVSNGVATLNAGGFLPSSQFNPASSGALAAANNLSDLANAATARTSLGLGTAAIKNAGAASGVADLDGGSKVPIAQLPAGTANGLASLDALGKVPSAQLNVAIANGIATLNSSGLVPASQLPTGSTSPTTVAKSADYTTVAGDQGKVIGVTTGSSTDVNITFVSPVVAGDGATMIVAKVDSGTKKVIVKDASSAVIAWLSNQNDTVVFRSNGSAWSLYWSVISPRIELFIANGTWTKPPLAATVFVSLQGPGGGGGLGGNGGGGGARVEQWFNASDLSATETVTVPAGGAGGTSATGGNGSPTTFGTTIRVTAGGGKGGGGLSGGTLGDGGGAGGSSASGNAGGWEGAGIVDGQAGKCGVYGGGSGGSQVASSAGLAGGSSLYGGGGGGAGGQGGGNGGAGGKRGTYTAGGGAAGGSGSGNGSSGGSLGVGGGGAGGGGTGTGGVGGVGAGGGGGGGGGAGGNGGAGGRGEATVTTVY